jgi:putative drug exporter of the RND superfamily
VSLQYPEVQHLDPTDLDDLKETVAELRSGSTLQIEAGGDLFFAFEQPETGGGERAGLVVAALLLLLAFGSFLAAGLPIGIALTGLTVGVGGLSLLGHLFDVPTWSPTIGGMIGLGVGIDYALFLLTRHREHLSQGISVPEAVGLALATAGQAVLFAGGIVVVAVLGLAVAGIPFVTTGGVAVSMIVLVMVAAALTLLPAFLGLAGHRVRGRRARRQAPAAAAHVGATEERWRRWISHVVRHPWVYAAGATAVLVAMTAPVLSMRLGIPDDGALSPDRTERRAYDLVADGFGPGTNGPLVVAVDVSDGAGVVTPLRRAVAADAGIASVTPAEVDLRAGVASFVAIPTTGPQDESTGTTVDRLRDDVLPSVLVDSPAKAHIGGLTATFLDLGQQVSERLPRLIIAVIALSFLLLVVVFRSILVPLKAALLNLLGIGASYGVIVAVFQWGWAKDLVGLEGSVPVVSFIPLFMFALLFGLSMDYEVFLLSRVREHYLLTGDNTEAVVHGIAGSARVITSAALIMVSVFLGFVATDDPFIKMFGLGLATAIAVDATIVRMVLVPALMQLLGDRNWWLPGWLDRLLPSVDPDGAQLGVEVGVQEGGQDGGQQSPLTGRPSGPQAAGHRVEPVAATARQ